MIRIAKTTEVPMNGEVTVSISWDGEMMHFFAGETEVLDPVPYDGLSNTFGIYWVTGFNSTVRAQVNEIRVVWDTK